MQIIKEEPAVIIGAIQAAIALAVSFGLKLTTDQIGAIVAIAAVVLSIVLRQKVKPMAMLTKAEKEGK